MSDSAGDLRGRVAIVTGAGGVGGIGETTARTLAEAGAKVVVSDLATSELETVWAALVADGFDVARRPTDISDEGDVRGLVAFTVETFGRLDVVDNNAASNHLVPLDTELGLDVELWDAMFAVIVRGTMLVCRHAIPEMVKQGKGSIINISSGKSLSGDIDQAAYSAAKNGVNALTRSVATMFGKQGIRCNTVSPGVIQTALMKAVVPEHMADLYRENNALPYLGEPRDIAELVVFLASDRSRYITGQLISVDGGYHSHAPIVAQIRHLGGELQHLTPLATDDSA
jgi:NAD(P)-dependent dehydrogenase (short-subunit alcohol dehydrogenase family)